MWVWVQILDLAEGLQVSNLCLKASNRMVTRKLGLQKLLVIWHYSSWFYAIIMHQQSASGFWMKAQLFLLVPGT